MAEITLAQVGAVVGSAVLPGGASLFGLQVSGAAIGAAVGGYAGRAIDAALAPAIEGPRLASLHMMEARDGAPIADVYGRMRVGGQLIWATRFKERRREQSAGKGGPKFAAYSYTVSLAVAIAEGPVTRIDRVWANGEVLRLADYNWRLYNGDEDQLPDPLVEAVEGEGAAPAYRGTAYMVFEDLPLDAFGNRLPQFSFEVVRASQLETGLRTLAKGVNIIPASGEFVYGTEVVRERYFPGIERPLNMNNGAGEPDFSLSLRQLTEDLPALEAATLTVGWFGSDLRAGQCKIRPGVETRDRSTVPYQWSVGGQGRGAAYQVSQTDGAANYGGTPADDVVLQGIAALKADGIAVTLSPFLLMDVPPGNALPDPYGAAEQAAFPWRGRIVASADKSATVRSEIETFLGTDEDFGYRHFILHHARLVVEAGGVDTILLGSEMRGLTHLRDNTGAFPFVEGLVQLASDVRAIVGPEVKISYAADWTEYGAYVPVDVSGDVLFPLDALWASPDVDFVGVDWYAPAGDWRDGEAHLDWLAGYRAADDPAYLESQMAGGEGYDWYYASESDRDAQVRTPIVDTAHGEHWVFRQKDLSGWWSNAHHERPGGVRRSTATDWSPGLKPVRLIEIGFPAVDKGGNAPNLFYDPKSAESALPPYSSGERDDVYQRRALETALAFWQAQDCVSQSFIWAWDARPWPDFPVRESVWSDGPNWAIGHWLNGRTSLIGLDETITAIGARAGVVIDADALDGLVEGYLVAGPMPLRRALEPLKAVYGLALTENESGLVACQPDGDDLLSIDDSRLVAPGVDQFLSLLDKPPGRLRLSYISADGSYSPASTFALSNDGDAGVTVDAVVPLVLSDAVASDLAARLLASALEPERATFALPPDYLHLQAGDAVSVTGEGSVWRIGGITDDGLTRHISVHKPSDPFFQRAASVPVELPLASLGALPELILVDAPSGVVNSVNGPLVGIAADPWPGATIIRAGSSAGAMTERGIALEPAAIGLLISPLASGAAGRWDTANALDVRIPQAALSGADPQDVLGGINRILVRNGDFWELIGYCQAELLGHDQWRLTRLLRGLGGSMISEASEGATCVLVDDRLVSVPLGAEDVFLPLVWQAGAGAQQEYAHQDAAGLSWSVAHLRAVGSAAGAQVQWLPRGKDIPDNWDLPDPTGTRQFLVEGLLAGDVIHEQLVSVLQADVPPGCDEIRVGEVGTDGRVGHRVSIAP